MLNIALTTGLAVILSMPGPDAQAPTAASRGPIAKRYAATAERIVRATLAKNDAWSKMEELCDGIGHRLSGSESLEKAVAWAVATMKADRQDNVRAERVMVPKWVRGKESAVMVEPRRHVLAMLGIGRSVGTPPDGITAPVEVVEDEKALEALGSRAAGKIILFNNPMPEYDAESGAGYGTTVRFRSTGAKLAAEKGAVACLVRSVTAHSLRSPHTGAMRDYGDVAKKIPAAAISTEDADMISRLRARDKKVVVTLKMQARMEADAPSANVIGELRGRERPDEIVVIGGHLDSWDVGQGAHDDGGGCVISMEAINVLRRLNLIPRRTIRVVLFTNEENGLRGGRAYAADHAEDKHVAAIESDSGIFRPTGFSVDFNDDAKKTRAVEQMRDLVSLLESIGPMKAEAGGSGADVGPMKDRGFGLLGFRVEGSKYFDYHHTRADTLDKIDPADLSRCTAVMAVAAYILADMPEKLGEPGE